MFCPKCGHQNIDNSTFCLNCGSPLQTAVSSQQQSQYPPPQGQYPQGYMGYPPQVPKKSRKGLIIGLIIAGVVLVAAAVVLVILLTGGTSVVGLWYSEESAEVLEFKDGGSFSVYTLDGNFKGEYVYDKGKGEGVITVEDNKHDFKVEKNELNVEDNSVYIRAGKDFDIDAFIQDTAIATPTPEITVAPTMAPTPTPTTTPEISNDQISDQALIDYFIEVAVTNPQDTSKWNGLVRRWEEPVRVEVIGDTTDEDWNTLNNFLVTLGQIVPGLDIAFLEGEGTESGNLTLSFVPTAQMAGAASNYKPGDKGCYYIYWDDNCRVNKGVIAIDTAITNQKERNSLIVEFVTRSLGILNRSSKYPDSIFYNEWSKPQSLSTTDAYIVEMLYSNVIFAGQSEAEARVALAALDFRSSFKVE